MTDRERKLAYMWFCNGYNHGYDAGEFEQRYAPRKAWAEILEKQKKGEEKYGRAKQDHAGAAEAEGD